MSWGRHWGKSSSAKLQAYKEGRSDPDEWKKTHHQGGAAAYELCESPDCPGPEVPVRLGQEHTLRSFDPGNKERGYDPGR